MPLEWDNVKKKIVTLGPGEKLHWDNISQEWVRAVNLEYVCEKNTDIGRKDDSPVWKAKSLGLGEKLEWNNTTDRFEPTFDKETFRKQMKDLLREDKDE